MRAPVIAALAVAALLGAPRAGAQPATGEIVVGSASTGQLFHFLPGASGTAHPAPLALDTPLTSPRGIAVDRNGLLAVTDIGTHQLSRIDPLQGKSARMVQFSVVTTTPRGVAALSDGRVFVADPGIAPPNVTSLRGITRFPVLYRVDLIGGVPGVVVVAGCSSLPAEGKTTLPNCGVDPTDPEGNRDGGNFYFPGGIAVRSEAPVVEILVADSGLPHSQCDPMAGDAASGRCRQSVVSVLPDDPFVPGVNDRPFCAAKDAPDPSTNDPNDSLFGSPRGIAIDPADGSVLVVDGGDTTASPQKPPRIFRIPPGGCSAADPLDAGDIVYPLPGGPNALRTPAGIVVAHGLAGVPDGTLFVADSTADTVLRIDPLAQVASVALDAAIDGAWDLQVYDTGSTSPYFVADAGNPRLIEVDPQNVTQVPLTGAPAALSVLDSNLAAWRALVAEPAAQLVEEAPFPSSALTVSDDRRLLDPTSAVPEAPVGKNYLATDLGSPAGPLVAPAVIRIDPARPSPDNQTLLSWGGLLVNPVGGAATPDGRLIVLDAGSLDVPPRIVAVDPTPPAGTNVQTLLFQGPPLTQRSAPCTPPDAPRQPGKTCGPVAIAIDQPQGNVLVADAGDPTLTTPIAPRILRFVENTEGSLVPTLVAAGGAAGGLQVPGGIATDIDHSILATQPETSDPALKVVRVDHLSGLVTRVATAAGAALQTPTGVGVDSDLDFDGVPDSVDNCFDPTGQANTANTDQKDADGDGQGDACDPDDDADAVPDLDGDGFVDPCTGGQTAGCDDNCRSVANPGQEDADGDGIGDACDDCPTVANADQRDTDGDGLPDACTDDDDDGDGVKEDDGDGVIDLCPDTGADITKCDDNCPLVRNLDQANHAPETPVDRNLSDEGDACEDTDGDGILNTADNCVLKANAEQADADADGTGDDCDDDDDNDAVPDASDNCPLVPNGPNESGQGEVGNQNPDACADTDGDGVANFFDNCATLSNALQVDTDHDGFGDDCDFDDDDDGVDDSDGDGVSDPCTAGARTNCDDNCRTVSNANQADNDADGVGQVCDDCPSAFNPGQENSDADFSGDACDLDDDNDGIPDLATPTTTGRCTGGATTGCDDNCPTVANPQQEDDDDGDGVGSACDNCRTVANGPAQAGQPAGNQTDLDGDGVGDACDNCPMVANDQRDDDGDGIGNLCDPDGDFDGDGVPDSVDDCRLVANPSQLDTNGDGFGNACDADYDDDGVVGVSDFATFGMAFGSQLGTPSEPRYDPDVDVDGDGGIGVREFALFGMSFGLPPGP